MWGGRGQPIRGPQHFILLSQCLYRGGRFGWCACRTHKSGGARIRQAKHPEGIDRAAKKELLRSHYRQRYAALVELGRLFCPWDEGEARVTSPPVRQPARCCPRKRHVWGDEGKAVGCVPPTGCVLDADQRRRFAKCYRVTARLFRGAASSCFAGSLSAWDAGLGGGSLNGRRLNRIAPPAPGAPRLDAGSLGLRSRLFRLPLVGS